jgi:hypothetical protein
MKLFDPKIFDPKIFDTGVESQIVSTARSGGGASYRRRKQPEEIKLVEKIEEKKQVIENIVVEILSVVIKVELNNIEIETHSDTEVLCEAIQLKIESNNISIENIQDYYDENESIKLLLLLAA